MPNARTKQAAASALVNASIAPASGKFRRTMPERRGKSEQQRLKREPLAGKAVQERQPRNRHRTDQEAQSRPRHATQQTTELFDLSRARRHDHAAGAEEQQPLEDRVIQHVHEAGRDGDGRQRALTVGECHHRGSQTQR